jgi:chaperonin GroEL (HSP60 family)
MLSLVYAIHHIDLTTTSFCAADKFRADLMNIAMTTLSSKILSQDKEYFAELAVVIQSCCHNVILRILINVCKL